MTFTIPGIGGGGGGDTNYGMNTNAGTARDLNGNYISTTGATDPNGKILAMDYDRYIIRGDDLWSDTDFHPNPISGVPGFARHLGMVNVLFTDGAVSLHDPAELDPKDNTIRLKYYDY
jgi:prepilin-type processing-associated H-X9-DG protein